MDRMSDSEILLESNDCGDKLPLYNDVINRSSSSPLKTSLPAGNQSNTNTYPPVYVNTTIAEEPQALYNLICDRTLDKLGLRKFRNRRTPYPGSPVANTSRHKRSSKTSESQQSD